MKSDEEEKNFLPNEERLNDFDRFTRAKWRTRRHITIGSVAIYFVIIFYILFIAIPDEIEHYTHVITQVTFFVSAITAYYFGGSTAEMFNKQNREMEEFKEFSKPVSRQNPQEQDESG